MFKRKVFKGISLLEVLIAFAATTVFVAVSAPMSRDMGVRLRVLDSMEVVPQAQEALAITCLENPQARVRDNRDAGFFYVPGGNGEDYLSRILLTADCAKGEMVIQLWTVDTGALQDPVLEVSTALTGEDAWTCHLLKGETKHVPGICRNQYPRTEG